MRKALLQMGLGLDEGQGTSVRGDIAGTRHVPAGTSLAGTFAGTRRSPRERRGDIPPRLITLLRAEAAAPSGDVVQGRTRELA